MTPIHFRVALIPTAKGRPRFGLVRGHARAFTPAATQLAETTFSSLAAEHAPPSPLQGPLAVTLRFDMPPLSGWPAWQRDPEVVARMHHDKKPDLDNLAKLVLDALQRSGAWWRDDAQVARLTASKGYALSPGTTVTIEQLEQPTRPARGRTTATPSAAQPTLFPR